MAKPTKLQQWIQAEMDARDWSQAKLGREIGRFKGTVGRWMTPENEEAYRAPDYESCRRLASVFGVDLRYVLELAGKANFGIMADNSTSLQRDVISVVLALPDAMLVTIYPQLRALLDISVQNAVRDQMAEAEDQDAEGPRSDPAIVSGDQ